MSARLQRGFTLIEIMMTVALTALIFAMIGGILLSVIQATENIETKLLTEKAGYGILNTIRRDLGGVYAYGLGGPAFKGEDKTELGRDADALFFVTTADVLTNEDGSKPRFVEVGYRVEAREDDLLGLYRSVAAFEGDPLDTGTSYVEIFGGVHSLNLEYLEPENREWQEDWSSNDTLPLAIRVRLELALDENQRAAAEAGEIDIPPPVYEMVVGIPTMAQPLESDAPAEGSQPPSPGG